MAAWPFILVLHPHLQWEALGKAAVWRGAGRRRTLREWLWGPQGTHGVRARWQWDPAGTSGKSWVPQPFVSVLLPR